eukprot:s4521_g4.t1
MKRSRCFKTLLGQWAQAALEDQLSHLQKGLQLCQEAREVFEQDATSNSTEVALQHQKDRQLAVKVLEKALGAGAEDLSVVPKL